MQSRHKSVRAINSTSKSKSKSLKNLKSSRTFSTSNHHTQPSHRPNYNHSPPSYTSPPPSSFVPSPTTISNPSIFSIKNDTQLLNHFQTLSLSPTSYPQLNQDYDTFQSTPSLHKKVGDLPPPIYAHLIQANLSTNNFSRVNQIILDSFKKNANLSPSLLNTTFKQLAAAGQTQILEQTISFLQQSLPSSLSPLEKHSNNLNTNPSSITTNTTTSINLTANPFLDPQTTTQLKESLVYSYITASRVQDSVSCLVQSFGPGSGSIPSDDIINTIVQHLLHHNRPRHAQQLLSKFDIYCSPKTKSKLYSKIAINFLDAKMISQLNQTLSYMESNSILPHQSMVERLLAHIVRHNNPLLSLKWYTQIYSNDKFKSSSNPIYNVNGGGTDNTTNELKPNYSYDQQPFSLKAANTILQSFFAVNHHHQGLQFLERLPIHVSSVNILLRTHYQSQDWDSLRLTMKYMLLRGLPLDQHGFHILIQSLGFHSHPAALTTLFDFVTLKQTSTPIQLHPTTCLLFIRALHAQGYPKLCEQILHRMFALGQQPDQSMYATVIQAYFDQNLPREAFRIKQLMESNNITTNLTTYTIFLNNLIQQGEALSLYHTITEMFDRANQLLDNEPYPQTHSPQQQQSLHSNQLDIFHHRSTEVIQSTQNDPPLTQQQHFLAYLRSYVKSACHLLSANGYKGHSDNLASFYLNSGGWSVSKKIGHFAKISPQSNSFNNIEPPNHQSMNHHQTYTVSNSLPFNHNIQSNVFLCEEDANTPPITLLSSLDSSQDQCTSSSSSSSSPTSHIPPSQPLASPSSVISSSKPNPSFSDNRSSSSSPSLKEKLSLNKIIKPKMFDVFKLQQLPANTFNDYIDLTDIQSQRNLQDEAFFHQCKGRAFSTQSKTIHQRQTSSQPLPSSTANQRQPLLSTAFWNKEISPISPQLDKADTFNMHPTRSNQQSSTQSQIQHNSISMDIISQM